MQVEQWQIDMARRTPPATDAFVQGSTPVISFGDALIAEVATIGINPSRREFEHGGWLRGSHRRLATIESLRASPGEDLTRDQARQVVEDGNRYFERNPYWKWFQPLDILLGRATQASYQDGSACHLDLVQWATDPVWGKLTRAADKKMLLDEGRPHLTRLLARSNVRLVLANGRTVLDQLEKIGIVQWETVGTMPVGHTACKIMQGESDGVHFVGWSTNLQGAFGVSNQFKAELAEAIKPIAVGTPSASEVLMPSASKSAQLDAGGHLQPIVTVAGKEQLAALLQSWYDQSDAATVGDVASFGGRPVIVLDLDGRSAVLNADTKRTAVAAYLAHTKAEGAEAPWQAVLNNRGRVNKLIFSVEPARAAGWYVYLRTPLAFPGTI